MKIFKKSNLTALFLAIGLFCFSQPIHAGTRTVLSGSKTRITDGVETATINPQGFQNIYVRDVNNLVLNRYAANFHGHTTTLLVAATAGDTSISIQGDDYVSFAVNDRLFLSGGGPIQENSFPIITAKPGSPVLTLNKPLDYAYPIGSAVQHVVIDASSDVGTLADPIVYRLQPPFGITFNVKGAILTMAMNSAGDYSKFGDIVGGLTNGVVARGNINGQLITRTSFRTNLDIDVDTSEPLVFHDKAGSGDFGIVATYVFEKFGAFIPLNGSNGDYFEILIQDDISSLTEGQMKFHGYITINNDQ